MNLVEGWVKTTLGECCSIEIGGTPSRNNPSYWDLNKETNNLWVSIKDLNKKTIINTTEYISDLGVSRSNVKRQKIGTVLLSFKLTIGKVSYVGKELYTNEAIAGLQPKLIDGDFLFQGLQQWDLLYGVDKAIKGATLNKEKLKNIIVRYPRLKQEQTQIATILSTIDKAIEQTEAIIAKQQRIKTGLMQDLLTRGIDKNGTIRSEDTHEFKDSALGRIPVEWDFISLEEKCLRITDGVHHKVHTAESGIPFLYVSCVRRGRILWEKAASISKNTYELISQGCEPKKGIVLYTVVGSYGYAALVSDDSLFSFQRHIGFISPDQEQLNPEFLEIWLNSPIINKKADEAALGNAQKTITLSELRRFPLLLPSDNEQKRIVKYINEFSKNTLSEEAYFNKLKRIKTALMQDLLTGKTRVTHLLK